MVLQVFRLYFIICLRFLPRNAAIPGCVNLTQHENICRDRYLNMSSACWLFQSCIRRECWRELDVEVSDCFDGVCDAGENVDNCPADCCPAEKNSSCSLSSLGKDRCLLSCCKKSTCCGDDNDGSTLLYLLFLFGLVLVPLVKKFCCSDNDNTVHSSGSGSVTVNCCTTVLRRWIPEAGPCSQCTSANDPAWHKLFQLDV